MTKYYDEHPFEILRKKEVDKIKRSYLGIPEHKMIILTLKNSFHNTTCNLRVKETYGISYQLSDGQVRKAWKELCGIKDCTCSNKSGIRDCDYYFDEITNTIEKRG